jgi:hypothetical protein
MKTHTGGCHCGKVRYEVKADLDKVISCNCSNCGKRGLLLKFVPEGQFKVTSGEESLKDYRFNKKQIAHMVCTDCGVEAFGRGTAPDGAKTVAVNIRCIDDIDVDSVPAEKFDGKSY